MTTPALLPSSMGVGHAVGAAVAVAIIVILVMALLEMARRRGWPDPVARIAGLISPAAPAAAQGGA